jgi:hypothetical protein
VFTASCHCGAVVLEIDRKPRKLTQCNCSLCRRYGALWAYSQRKARRVIAARDALEMYSWRGNRFEFYRCATCGCVTHYERSARQPDGSDLAAVNLRNVDDPAIIADLSIRLLDGAGTWKVLSEAPQPHLLRSPG